jgi:hypothetical protein
LPGIYREKILASFNRESTGGFGHYDGQFLDVTLMGRESTVSLLWEIFAKNNDDLENSAYRILAGQALQELQYTPPWLIEGLGNFFDIVLPQEISKASGKRTHPAGHTRRSVKAYPIYDGFGFVYVRG